MKTLIFMIILFCSCPMVFATEFDPGDLVDSSSRSRNLMENYSDILRTRFNVPDFFDITAKDEDMFNFKGKNFSDIIEDYFYYFSRGAFNNYGEAVLNFDFFHSSKSKVYF